MGYTVCGPQNIYSWQSQWIRIKGSHERKWMQVIVDPSTEAWASNTKDYNFVKCTKAKLKTLNGMICFWGTGR